jgi:hypothetical protein
MSGRCIIVLAAGLCTGCYGLASDSRYPDTDDVGQRLESPENEPDPGIGFDGVKFREELCEGLDVHTQTTALSQDDLSRFLAATGVGDIEVKARDNLYWFEFPGDEPEEGDRVRLRVAVLDNPQDAAIELHKSLLEHGPGWWGLRRSNLSVLAPKADLDEAVSFAVKYRLPCWGMVQMADRDDVYVVPGPYMEL